MRKNDKALGHHEAIKYPKVWSILVYKCMCNAHMSFFSWWFLLPRKSLMEENYKSSFLSALKLKTKESTQFKKEVTFYYCVWPRASVFISTLKNNPFETHVATLTYRMRAKYYQKTWIRKSLRIDFLCCCDQSAFH